MFMRNEKATWLLIENFHVSSKRLGEGGTQGI